MVNSQTIPVWFVAAMMLYTGFIWLVTRKVVIRMDTRIFALTFILEGLVYALAFSQLSNNIEYRGFLSRLMVVMICFSQAFPLTISYIRSLQRRE